MSVRKFTEKLEVLNSFMKFDDVMTKVLKRRQNYEKVNRRSTILFIFFLIASLINFIKLVESFSIFPSNFFAYLCLTSFLNHLVHTEAFQLYVFVKAIQVRLKILQKEIERASESSLDFELLFQIEGSFAEIFDMNQKINNCFKVPLMFNLMDLYSTFIINSYWMVMSLWSSQGKISGKFMSSWYVKFYIVNDLFSDALLFQIPALLVLIILAQLHRETEKLMLKIVSTLTSISEPNSQVEDFLILLHRCQFSTTSYNAIDISFANFGKVSYD